MKVQFLPLHHFFRTQSLLQELTAAFQDCNSGHLVSFPPFHMDEYRKLIVKLHASDTEDWLCARAQEIEDLNCDDCIYPEEMVCGLCAQKNFVTELGCLRMSIYYGVLYIEETSVDAVGIDYELADVCDDCYNDLLAFYKTLPPRFKPDLLPYINPYLPPELSRIVAEFCFERLHDCPCVDCATSSSFFSPSSS
jgi:hypothetical protein